MQKSFVFSTFLFLVTGFSYEKRTFSDEEKILKAIQLICVDLWRENKNQFIFTKLFFNKDDNTTKVIFDMRPRIFPLKVQDNKHFYSSIDQKNFQMQCILKGYSTPQSVLAPDGSLNRSFQVALSGCILSLESQMMSVSFYEQPDKGVFLDWKEG